MMQMFSFHTHTDFSDGHNSVEEMLNRAKELGWEKIGISDHLIVHKNIRQSISWPLWRQSPNLKVYRQDFSSAAEDFSRHAEHVRQAAKNCGIKAFVGAEVDFFTYSGWEEEFAEFRRRTGLDYYISGNHFLEPEGESVVDIKDLSRFDEKNRELLIKKHINTICRSAESGIFSFIAHLDYVRKSPFCPDSAFTEEKKALIRCLAKHNQATEISTKGLRKRGDFYPVEWMLKEIIRNNIKLVISDDAHRTDELGFSFGEAERCLESFNFLNRWDIDCISKDIEQICG